MSFEIPYGCCHCGCGEKTTLASRNKRDKGWIKDQPMQYIHGHGNRGRHFEYKPRIRKKPLKQRAQKPTRLEKDKARFYDSFTPVTESGCWLWEKSTRQDYGAFFLLGQRQSAHRASWIIHNGLIPSGLCVLHKCDVPSCVNPNHLFLGTYQDNTDDKVSKNRHIKGETVPASKLKKEQVIRIRELSAEYHKRELAQMFGVGRTTIDSILQGVSWKSVL